MSRAVTVTLNDDLLRRLTVAAEAAGLSVEAYVAMVIETALSPGGMAEEAAAFRSAHDWTEADRRLADYDRTGKSVDAEAALDAFVAAVDADAAGR